MKASMPIALGKRTFMMSCSLSYPPAGRYRGKASGFTVVARRICSRQGWKIHISATPTNASKVLERVTSVLLENGDADFKFALDMSTAVLSE